MQNKFTISGFNNKSFEITPHLKLVDVTDFMGEKQHNIGLYFTHIEDGAEMPFANFTLNFCEFIGMKNCAYVDTNNCWFADELLETGIAQNTGFTKISGYCKYPLWQFKEEFLKQNGREPTVEETAFSLNTTAYAVSNALEAMSPALSLYEPVYSEEEDSLCLMDRIQGEDFENEFISKTVIQNVIHGLEKREKYILNLRFLQGKTQTQVAKIVGISQAQVSRIEKNVLVLVKKQLDI